MHSITENQAGGVAEIAETLAPKPSRGAVQAAAYLTAIAWSSQLRDRGLSVPDLRQLTAVVLRDVDRQKRGAKTAKLKVLG
jgi:hypothetical protein